VAAEAERIGDGVVVVAGAGAVGHDVEVDVGIKILQVERALPPSQLRPKVGRVIPGRVLLTAATGLDFNRQQHSQAREPPMRTRCTAGDMFCCFETTPSMWHAGRTSVVMDIGKARSQLG
jgi:hypothetical protein